MGTCIKRDKMGDLIRSCAWHILIIFLFNRLLGGVVVIAANAGGAWTPIGDVTTTMLWIHGQISTLQTMKVLLL